ncbi:hypothetical protein V2G26_009285 [Clonostachys chloroleuca]
MTRHLLSCTPPLLLLVYLPGSPHLHFSPLIGAMTSCLICGLKNREFVNSESHSWWEHELASRSTWWSDIRLLCDPDDELGSLAPSLKYNNIFEPCTSTNAEARVHDGFRPRSQAANIEVHQGMFHAVSHYKLLLSDGTKRDIFYRPGDLQFRTFDGRIYLPVHEVCLDIAQKVFEASPRDAYIRDLRALYLALGWRLSMKLKCEGPASREFPPNYMIGKANFHTNWEEWRSQVRMREFNPAHAWPGPYATPQENLPDVCHRNLP